MNFQNPKIQFSKGISDVDKREIEQTNFTIKLSTLTGTYIGCNSIEKSRRLKSDFDETK